MSAIDIRPEATLPVDCRVALLSDIHLGDGSANDLFGHKDDLFCSVVERETSAADVVVINGDALDHLQARTGRHLEVAHARALDALRNVGLNKPVYYVMGNHEDPAEIRQTFPGFRLVSAVTVGEDLCITHGHQFDLHWSDGKKEPLMARFHGFLERSFGRPIRQPFRDYDNPVNRVVHRLFYFWTQGIRFYGVAWRMMGRPDPYVFWQRVDNFWARGQWGDLGCVFQEVEQFMSSDIPWNTLVLGHSHQPGVVRIGDRIYANLGSWALESATYGRVRAGQIRVFDAATDREFGDERYQMLLSDQELPDMTAWFRRYYRGFFRYDLDSIVRDFPLV